jgi:geranylgeranyl diphosphate synthase type II
MANIDIMSVLAARGKPIGDGTIGLLSKEDDRLLKTMMLDYPLRGGKRLRSVLCIMSCEAFGGKVEDAMNTAIAFELFQHWILIHDDIEDYSEERRGKPALHKIYGMPLAINTGDALHFRMWEALFNNRKYIGPERTFKVLDEFMNMGRKCTEGQSTEIEWVENRIWSMKEEDYYTMAGLKTANYTFTFPFRIGAIIGGATDEQLKASYSLGEKVGIAFQIQDDALNLVGDKEKYGKELGGDLWEGKRTLMLIHLVNNCMPEERSNVIAVMNKNREEKTEAEVRYVWDLMLKYGSIDHAKRKAVEFASEAAAEFDREFAFLPETEAKAFIRGLFDFVINRDV